ncbi:MULTISPECIES: lipase family protein [Providencia]|uniref:Triacylglycerol lipase n=1 Tax=Providencia rettgeri TaxID=587 RepID=A0A264VS76_PRORE|nr:MULTISPECIES: lipase family protein [Providencia]EFE54729.1 triacylglycerol lipase [Providencia rettgeri DSM 1131]MBI6188915.1 lipase family protein [Providencia rettgeri]MCG9528005.1 lipase family protein [Providencia rettgeri]OZS74216.1 triacylglycerol lipase [Providencia rettgeri]QKG46006.1 lipase family protein [Providencia rettgeri]
MPYQYNDPYCADCSKRKAWIECVLVDEFNQPLAEMAYTLKVRNGVIRKGVTDAQGYLRQEDLPRTVATLTIESQKLTDEMEKRPLRTLRGEAHSTVKPDALLQGYSYRYAVIGELCDKAPDIDKWESARFGLPYYHFPKENEFNGLKLMGEDFNQRHVIEVCPFRAWSLILNHTPEYDMVNAYNLGLMSLLVYKNEVMVDPDKTEDMRDFINTPDTTTSFFYQQCFDLSQSPVIKDSHDYPAIVTDVPFNQRYRPVIFLDVTQSENHQKGDHDTKLFFVENETQIIVAWRGTASLRSVLTDTTYQPIPCPTTLIPEGKSNVHRGFLEAYQCVEKYFKENTNKIKDLSQDVDNKKLYICGHSLGGALALLHSSELRKNNPLLYTYGMPRVFTISGAKSLSSLNHYRHVNDADSVTSVPFDTNMDSWLFEIGGGLGTTLGVLWTVATLPTVPLQKSLPDFGEVYSHQGNPVSLFKARQIGEEIQYTHTGVTVGKKRWRMNGEYKFYLVPNIANVLNDKLQKEQTGLVQSLGIDKQRLDDTFPQRNNPNLDTIITMPLDHFMGSQYQAIINNQLLFTVSPEKTPKHVASKQRFEALTHHQDAYKLNAERNTTFISLESKLTKGVTQQINQNSRLKDALERYKEETHELPVS